MMYSTNPVVRLVVAIVAVNPNIVVLVGFDSSLALVEPVVFVTGVVRDEVHDQLQA